MASEKAKLVVDGKDDGANPQPSDAKASRKEPPKEKATDIRRRSNVILSFWLIVLCLGLPIWWNTTTIYRADLPLDQMMEWADGKACRPVFPLRISIQASSLQENEAQNLLRLTQHALDDLNDFSAHHLRLELAPRAGETSPFESDSDVALTIRLVPGETTTTSLHPYEAILDITYPPNSMPSASSSSSSLATFVATRLRQTFAEEQAIISYLLSTSSSIPSEQQQRPSALSAEMAELISKRTTRALKYAPTYHLTFSLFTAGSTPSGWAIESAIEEYLHPVLEVLSPIHNFTIDTQVQLYAAPGAQAQVLGKEDLSSFINAAEWPLSPSIGGAPTINFVVFVGNQTIRLSDPPKPEHAAAAGFRPDHPDSPSEPAPLDPSETSQSWLIPQWGSVYLLSLPPSDLAASHVPTSALQPALATFTSHLLTLLGVPSGSSSSSISSAQATSSLPLRLATLSRVRATDLFLTASSTLGSLARLTRALPSIAVPPSVADGVAATIAHLERACSVGGASGAPVPDAKSAAGGEAAEGDKKDHGAGAGDETTRGGQGVVDVKAKARSRGKGWGTERLFHAREAAREAERAFFEKSMVGQLYFPDEHKVAVYLPLLGPVGVPLVMGLINEIKGWRRRRREAAGK